MSFARVKCPMCKGKLEGRERIHEACIAPWADAQAQKAERRAAKASKAAQVEEKRQDRVKKEQRKGIPELIAEADKAFSLYVKLRDRLAGYVCISSGKPLDWSGNATDAGHWRSRGAASALRYHPDNCHAQSKHDNRYLAGNAVEYRMRLIERIGLARVEALEGMNGVHKWQKDELRAIKAEYMAKAKELKKRLDC